MLGVTAIRRYLAVMAAQGYPAEHVLAEAGLHGLRLDDPAALIAPEQYRQLVSTMVAISGREGLDLALTAFRDLGDLGIVGHASAASRTVRDTWRVWSRFGPSLVGMMGRLQISGEDARTVTMTVADPDPDDPLFRFSVEELLTMVRKVSRTPLSEAPSVEELTLSYRAPAGADRYAELFGCRLRFGARQTTIRVLKDWFDRPAEPHDGEFHAICVRHCESVLSRVESAAPMSATLRRLFGSFDREPLPRLEGAAERLRLTTRTLRRRLHEEGTSYRAELDRFRSERAQYYLRYADLDAKEIAFLLGFQEQSAFRHAFKTWTGKTVGDFRREARERPPAAP